VFVWLDIILFLALSRNVVDRLEIRICSLKQLLVLHKVWVYLGFDSPWWRPWVISCVNKGYSFLYWTKWALVFVCFSFFLATCARLSWSLNFLVHVNLFCRIISYLQCIWKVQTSRSRCLLFFFQSLQGLKDDRQRFLLQVSKKQFRTVYYNANTCG